jgi:hypothetical protein
MEISENRIIKKLINNFIIHNLKERLMKCSVLRFISNFYSPSKTTAKKCEMDKNKKQNKTKNSMTKQISINIPKDTKFEKAMDNFGKTLNILTVESTLGTVLGPVSILSGLWSLGRAQNVKNREAKFKAMAVDAAMDYLAMRNGKMPPLNDFPTLTQAAVGQKILGKGASLNYTFHNKRERAIFNNQYKKTLLLLKKASSTPAGRKELEKTCKDYKMWKRKSTMPDYYYFLKAR